MARGSSYDEGWVGGESPMILIRFPGEPANAGIGRAHSPPPVIGAPVPKGVAETASSKGEAVGTPFDEDGVPTGLISGDCTAEDKEVSEAKPWVLLFLDRPC